MSDDQLDIYDASLRPIGQMEWAQAHKAGHWHRTFHCWVFRDDGDFPRVLFQVRSPTVGNFPNMLDVSAAGHLAAGESVAEGVREVREELGITFDNSDLIYIGERVEVADEVVSGDKNREYQSVHLLRVNADLGRYRPQVAEVWGLLFMSVRDGLDLFSGRQESIVMDGVEYNQSSDEYDPVERQVTTEDFLPRIQRYYMAALISAERAAAGLRDIAIS